MEADDTSSHFSIKGCTNAAAYQAALARRRAEYLDWILDHFGALEPSMAPTDGRLWALSHARLLLGRDVDRANRYLQSFALTRDTDICFIRFLETLLHERAAANLSPAARARITDVLTAWPVNTLSTTARWPPSHTENHDLMHMTIRLFAQQRLGEDTSAQVREIEKSLAWRFERGFVEWNSACYQFHYSNPLILLAEQAPSEELRGCAWRLLNVLLAERAVLGVGGYLGGPSFRCRTADAENSPTNRRVAYLTDARYDAFLPTVWLAFGLGEPRFDFDSALDRELRPATTEYASANEPRLKQDEGMFFACSSLQPHPLVVALAEEAPTRGAFSYEGTRYLGWPGPDLGETLWETQRWMPAALYYYNTPHVSLGSVHSSGWICQSRYDKVLFAAQPSQGLRVEQMLPGVPPHKRRYEARGRVVQHQNWLLGQGTLFEDGCIQALAIGPWRIYQAGKGLCAHFALPDSYHVLQVADLDQYPSVEAFVQALSAPTMEGGEVHALTTDGDRVTVDLGDMSIAINSTPRPHPPAMLHDCPYLQSEYGSGEITVRTSRGCATFSADGITTATVTAAR